MREEDKHKKFAERVRAAARALGEFTAGELSDSVGVMTRREKTAVSAYIREFISRSEMARVDPAGPARRAINGKPCLERYRFVNRVSRITNRQRLWDCVRRMPTPFFGLKDLVQITEIDYRQVKRFCLFLKGAKWAERTGAGRYRLVKALPVSCPPDHVRKGRSLTGPTEGTEGKHHEDKIYP